MVEKYLERIRYKETASANLESLKKLQQQHLLHVPFENLDIHLKIPVELNLQKLFYKIVNKKRGGLCYELNGLFCQLLISLGFEAKMISARVYRNENEYSPEYDHLAIIVHIEENDYLADVGFGEFTFSPLKIEFDKIQNDTRDKFRITKYEGEYLQVNRASEGEWRPEYIFTLKPRMLSEFEPMCLYHQTSPESHFTKNKLCSILVNEGISRITITNNKLKITGDGKAKEEAINNDKEFEKYLWEYFQIKID